MHIKLALHLKTLKWILLDHQTSDARLSGSGESLLASEVRAPRPHWSVSSGAARSTRVQTHKIHQTTAAIKYTEAAKFRASLS
jgi:hypothetical protein